MDESVSLITSCMLSGLLDDGPEDHLGRVVEWAKTADPAECLWVMKQILRADGRFQRAINDLQHSRLTGAEADGSMRSYIERAGDFDGVSPFAGPRSPRNPLDNPKG